MLCHKRSLTRARKVFTSWVCNSCAHAPTHARLTNRENTGHQSEGVFSASRSYAQLCGRLPSQAHLCFILASQPLSLEAPPGQRRSKIHRVHDLREVGTGSKSAKRRLYEPLMSISAAPFRELFPCGADLVPKTWVCFPTRKSGLDHGVQDE